MWAVVTAALAAGAAFQAACLVLVAVRRVMARYRERYGVVSMVHLGEALPFLERRDQMLLALALGSTLALAGLLASGIPAAIAGVAAGGAAPPLLVQQLRSRRIRRFDEQLVGLLEATAAGLRAGHSLQQAFEAATAESASPLREEFGLALREIRMGASAEQALRLLAERVASEELRLFVTATELARQTGGNLAATYAAIATALRERFRLEGKLRAMTAQGRMQGWVVGVLPLLLAWIVARMRPDLVEPMLAHPFGWALVAAVLLLEIAGFVWIRHLVTLRF